MACLYHIGILTRLLIKGDIDTKNLDNLIFHLGMAEIPTYWKTTCSPEIIIKAGGLEKSQITWWHNLLIKGMGEFFFKNKINFLKPDFVKIKAN